MPICNSGTPGIAVKTLVTLVLASTSGGRERAIASAIRQAQALMPASVAPANTGIHPPCVPHAVLLEGLPDGQCQLEDLLAPSQLIRIAPGCLCCIGNTVMRVSINRLLRYKPARLFIALSDASHHAQLRTILQQAPYDQWLELGADLLADPC